MVFERSGEASSFASPCTYHVFLSFRGKDTRKSFTDRLYAALVEAGFRTFRDDNEIERGENINSELEKAIKQSRSSIIVISRNYATSRWCLDELVMILELKRTKGHAVLPVFYHVDPADVKNQTGPFFEAFSKHEKRYNEESDEGYDKVQKWRAALREVADLAAVTMQEADGAETESIQKILDIIEDKVNHTISSVAPYLVGISYRVKEIREWLQNGSSDASVVAIYGMSGIGKTTIARYLFVTNYERFEGSSFLSNIRDTSEQPNGLVRLQRQFLLDLTGKKENIRSSGEGINRIKDVVCCRRILLVLDDVENLDQLNVIFGMIDCFCPGSKIIITTRNMQLLEVPKFVKVHEVKRMGIDHSLELFSWHAFGEDHPYDDYAELSTRIVKHCGGIPLALKVLGSSLRGKITDVWRSAIEKLEVIPASPILGRLKLGYDLLRSEHDKNLFLDIACFFTGKDADYVVTILDGCDFRTKVGIRNLRERCLLTIEGRNKLTVHQLLRDVGREIVRQESTKKPGRRSRIWHHRDSFNVLREKSGTEKVEGLVLDMNMVKEDKFIDEMFSISRGERRLIGDIGSSERTRRFGLFTWNSINNPEVYLKTDAFTVMDKLRLLQLNYVQLSGSFGEFPRRLRWLSWRGFPLNSIPDDFPLDGLVAMDVRNSNLERLWKGTRFLWELKVLNLSHSHWLTRTPDFTGLPRLERLILKDCVNLAEVDESIGNLDHELIFLNLKDCVGLKHLPRSICLLKALRSLIISGCSNLEELPKDLWKLESLEVFSADGITLGPLASIRQHNSSWPTFILFWMTRPRKLPQLPWVSLPRSLVRLSLAGCNLSDNSFPEDFGNFPLLQDLNLGRNPIHLLPDCITHLSGLNKLDLSWCTMLKSLTGLPGLAELAITNCTSLEKITYQSSLGRARRLYNYACDNLFYIEWLFKIEPVETADPEILKTFGFNVSDLTESVEVELFNHSTFTESKGPIKVLDEYGLISSIFYPGSQVPNWFGHKNAGATITLNVSSSPGLQIRGLNVCCVYSVDRKGWIPGEHFYIIVSNTTKNVNMIYGPISYGLPRDNEEMLWSSHWKFRSQLDVGDELYVLVIGRPWFVIKEVGIGVVYGNGELKSEEETERAYPYQGLKPDGYREGKEFYCFGHLGNGLGYFMQLIP